MVLNEEQFKAFSLEISTFGNIPISSEYCGIGCIFCKVHTDSFLGHYPKIPRIDKDDLIRGFKYVNPKVNYVRLGAGVLVAPHTDPFLHPSIYEFIKMASDYFPDKKITTVTTGAYVQEKMVDYLNNIPNFGIDLSLITMQDIRERIIPRSERNRTMYLLNKAPINKCTLIFTGNIDDIKKDLELLYNLNINKRASQILIRRMEHTSISQNNLKKISNESINNYEKCIEWVKNNYPDVVYTVPILKDVFRGGNNEYFIDADERISKQKDLVNSFGKNININIICSESTYDYFKKAYIEFNNVHVHLIKNKLYGGSVTVSGLLSHRDIIQQFNSYTNDVMFVPSEMYNSEDKDILGEPRSALEEKYNAKVIMT